jgi:hypothetical protein
MTTLENASAHKKWVVQRARIHTRAVLQQQKQTASPRFCKTSTTQHNTTQHKGLFI